MFFPLLIIFLVKLHNCLKLVFSLFVIKKMSNHKTQSSVVIGGSRPEQCVNKISVIGGGDLGMAVVLSIMAKVNIPNFSLKMYKIELG